jgi:flavorubredoxin
MSRIDLFTSAQHQNICFDESEDGGAVQANNHLIVHDGTAIVLDPGGHKAFRKLLADTASVVPVSGLKHLFLSHQDPDIVAGINGWLMTTDADAWASSLWKRFIPHFGLDHLVADRLKEIPDEGMVFDLKGVPLLFLPAHFLHSAGNFHVYDPVSKILYSGDLGASLGQPYTEVPDFQAHRRYMDGFHRRYMASAVAMKAWANMVRDLDIEMIAPQHGAFFRGKAMVQQFIDWAADFPCGVDLLVDRYRIPGRAP